MVWGQSRRHSRLELQTAEEWRTERNMACVPALSTSRDTVCGFATCNVKLAFCKMVASEIPDYTYPNDMTVDAPLVTPKMEQHAYAHLHTTPAGLSAVRYTIMDLPT